MLYAQVNAEGLNEGVLEMDERSAAAHPLPAGWRLLRVTLAEHKALGLIGHAARHDGRAWHRLPEAHVRRRDRLAGFNALEVLANARERGHNARALDAAGMLRCLAPSPSSLELPELPAPIRHFPIPRGTLLPDLVIREITAEEAELLATAVVASTRYEGAEEYVRAMVDTWVDSPFCWPLATTWRGQPLQLECYHFALEEPGIARAGFTTHLTRERPAWFWRECERPVFEALRAVGVTRVISRTRDDREDWIQALKTAYGARESLGQGVPNHTALSFDIETTLALSPGWPARRTAGVGWEYRAGDVLLREAAEAELAAIDAWLVGHVPSAQAPTARRMLDEWWHLDHAACLVVYEAGALADCRVIRERRGDRSNIGSVGPIPKDALADAVTAGVRAWHQAVGYATISAFVPASMVDHPRVAAQLARSGFRRLPRVKQYPGGAFIEFEADI